MRILLQKIGEKKLMFEIPLIILNGIGTCGKDTFMNFCSEFTKCYHYSTIDYYKEIAKEYFDWDEIKDEKGRKLLSDLKIASINYNNMPMKILRKEYDKICNEKKYNIFFCVCRDIQDIEYIKANYKRAYSLLITNDNIPKITSNEGDANVLNYEYDYVIENNGTLEELSDKARDFCSMMLNRIL